MATKIKPELSRKNKYFIEKHRYYELKHFSLQYIIWKKAYAALDNLSKRPDDLASIKSKGVVSDPTARTAIAKDSYRRKIDMIEQAAEEADKELAPYIILGVTEGLSYDNLYTYHQIPCCRDVYYDRYRKYFWALNKIRD